MMNKKWVLIVLLGLTTACGGSSKTSNNADLDKTVENSLSAGDYTYDGHYYDEIPVNIPEGSSINVTVSSEFDAVLYLFQGEFQSVDDAIADGDYAEAGEVESLSYDDAAAGDFTLVITSYESGETGSYTLNYTITETPNDDSGGDGGSGGGSDEECHSNSECGSCYSCRNYQCYYTPLAYPSSCGGLYDEYKN